MSPHTLSTTELEQVFNDGNWPLLSAFARGTYANKSSHLLQMLILLQRALGCIPEPLQQQLALDLNINKTQVNGVVEFYFFLCEKPRGRYQIFFSNNIIDKNHGAETLIAWLCKRLHVNFEEPRADGLVFIGESACIGLSDQAPALLINGRSIARLDLARLEQIATLIEAQQPLEHWPNELFDITDTVHRKDWFFNSAFSKGASIKRVLNNNTNDVWEKLDKSGLKGRGGAGFPTTKKWHLCAQSPAENRVVVCNADEGEPGTFKDRVLLTHEAHRVIEGMTLCAYLIGARQGFIYLRGEYFYLLTALEKILAERRSNNLLGNAILGQTNFDFDIEIHLGAGAYICGEESALIESLEGKRGIPRKRPPFPVSEGYLGLPTVVNNVETFAMAATLFQPQQSGDFAQLGTTQSKGSKVLSISGDCKRPGIYEYPWGVSIRQILADCGAEHTAFVQVGGPAGEFLSELHFDRKLCYADVSTGGSFMIFNASRDPFEIISNFAAFFAHESCGFCTPCRVGTQLNQQLFNKIRNQGAAPRDLEKLTELGALMDACSFCGLGKTASHPIRQGLAQLQNRLIPCSNAWSPDFDIDQALQPSRDLRAPYAKGKSHV